MECHTPGVLPPTLLGLLAPEGELDNDQPLTGEQLVMTALGSSANSDGIASLLVAVINSEMPAPRGLVHTAVQRSRAASVVDRKMAAASKQLRQSVGGARTGIGALVCELSVAMSHASVGQLEHMWETVLVSWEGASGNDELDWTCLAGFSLVSTVIEFSTALLSGKVAATHTYSKQLLCSPIQVRSGEDDGTPVKDDAIQR